MQFKDLSIILIKTDWCNYCKVYLPEFLKLKDKMKNSGIKFYIVDGENVKNYNLPKIKKYPTILFYNKTQLLGEYTQDRDLLEKYINQLIRK